jgi:hypothetical protein
MTRVTIVLFTAAAIALPAAAQPEIAWHSIDAGGGFSSGGSLELHAVIGQPDAGVASGSGYELYGGFLAAVSRNCPPDYNGDGVVNSQDFVAFLNDFVAGNPDADYNDDGVINSQDFVAFLNDFVAGC